MEISEIRASHCQVDQDPKMMSGSRFRECRNILLIFSYKCKLKYVPIGSDKFFLCFCCGDNKIKTELGMSNLVRNKL
jgi:hypothetical protein